MEDMIGMAITAEVGLPDDGYDDDDDSQKYKQYLLTLF